MRTHAYLSHHRNDSDHAATKRKETPFMQYRNPVGGGPSSKTWPRWPPQRRQCTSVRTVKNRVRSSEVPMAFSSGAQKLGQPVPLSNLVVEENRGKLQPAQ